MCLRGYVYLTVKLKFLNHTRAVWRQNHQNLLQDGFQEIPSSDLHAMKQDKDILLAHDYSQSNYLPATPFCPQKSSEELQVR